MTLLLGMSKAEGVYMSSDYRVTDARSGTLINDESIKFLDVHYPPPQTGPAALFGYTGLAVLRDGTPTMTWIRETLRGESDVIDASMAHLRSRLDRDIAPLRLPLIINTLVIERDRRLVGGFTNVQRSGNTLDAFEYVMTELAEPFWFVNGSGGARAIADGHMNLVRSQLHVKPRKAFDHMKLLASVNRRVAAADKTVSPFCHVALLGPIAEQPWPPVTTAHVFKEKGEEVPVEVPSLLFGIDLTDLEALVRRLRGGPAGRGPSACAQPRCDQRAG